MSDISENKPAAKEEGIFVDGIRVEWQAGPCELHEDHAGFVKVRISAPGHLGRPFSFCAGPMSIARISDVSAHEVEQKLNAAGVNPERP